MRTNSNGNTGFDSSLFARKSWAKGQVISVNVGQPRVVHWKDREISTSIWKSPVAHRVPTAGNNLAGDRQADLHVHGGPDKAVYAYAAEDYWWWESMLNQRIEPGTFGENLTVLGIQLNQMVIGEVWNVGTTTLQVTQPRMACYKLAARMDDPGFASSFNAVARPGVYLRILGHGDVGQGDAVDVINRPTHGLTIEEIFNVHSNGSRRLLTRIANSSDVPEDWRNWASGQLGSGTPEQSTSPIA